MFKFIANIYLFRLELVYTIGIYNIYTIGIYWYIYIKKRNINN